MNAPDPRAGRIRSPHQIVEFIVKLLGREASSTETLWPDSVFPSSGAIYLVGDGYGSSSTRWLRTPWLETVRPAITEVHPHTIVRGFSYSRPGVHYSPGSTDISLLNHAYRRFRPYAPILNGLQATTYLGFSLGANVFTLGLGEHLKTLKDQPTSAVAQAVPALILVQPPLSVSDEYIEAAMELERPPTLFADLFADGPEIHKLVMESVSSIAGGGTRVFVIFWPHDRFARYSSNDITRLREVGASVVTIDDLVPTATDPFLQHCETADHPATLRALRAVLNTL